ncbi:MAG: leucyl/phenylalanyl-tRNA--protein transferase [Rhodospirillaceae bacterium]|nr:leucyl/phenylalanyl-tRNA--protein transferase [Rhodospirillaceae bacterium]
MSRPIPGPHKLSPEILVRAYAAGVFPMSESRDDPTIFWVDPRLRGIIPLDNLHVSKSLKKTIRKNKFEIKCDTAFDRVIEGCALPRADHDGSMSETWINDEIIRAYNEMHKMGLAHSVECWRGERLVGGLYGVSLRGAFCGESMFSLETDASKVALVYLVAHLKLGGYALLDTQFLTDHLKTMGAVEISNREYLERLERALGVDAKFPLNPNADELEKSLNAVLENSK